MCSFETRSHCYSSNLHVQTAREEFRGHVTSAESEESESVQRKGEKMKSKKNAHIASNCSTLNFKRNEAQYMNVPSFEMTNRSLLSGFLEVTLTGLFLFFFSLTYVNLVKLFLNPTQLVGVLYTDLMQGDEPSCSTTQNTKAVFTPNTSHRQRSARMKLSKCTQNVFYRLNLHSGYINIYVYIHTRPPSSPNTL